MKKFLLYFLMLFILCGASYASDSVRINSPSLGEATVGEYYSYQFFATGGGTGGIDWSMSGSIPGMSFSSGLLAGEPTTSGRYSFTVTARARYTSGSETIFPDSVNCTLIVKDKDGNIGDGGSTFDEGNDPSIEGELGSANVGDSFRSANQVYGRIYMYATIKDGTPPFKWTVIKGDIPKGLSLALSDYEGAISGTPTDCRYAYLDGMPVEAGTFDFTLRITDANERTAEKDFSVNIGGTSMDLPLEIKNSTDGGGDVVPVPEFILRGLDTNNLSLMAEVNTSPRAPYTWSIESGKLPDGVTLKSSNSIYNGPYGETGKFVYASGSDEGNGNGTFKFVIKVTDADGRSARKQFSMIIEGKDTDDPDANGDETLIFESDPKINNAFTESGQDGQVYSSHISATEGTAPYTWSLAFGELPEGLTLTVSDSETDEGTGMTGKFAHITGTPKYPVQGSGYSNFILKVEDSNGNTNAKCFRIKISEAESTGTDTAITTDKEKESDTVKEPEITAEEVKTRDVTLDIEAKSHDIIEKLSILDVPDEEKELKELPSDSMTPRGVDKISAKESEDIAKAGQVIVVVLPTITVDESNTYIWAVNVPSSTGLESGKPIALKLSAGDAGDFDASAITDSTGILIDDEGGTLTTLPESRNVNIAAYLESGKTYAPIITTSASTSSNPSSSSGGGGGGGCNTGFGLMISCAALIALTKRA